MEGKRPQAPNRTGEPIAPHRSSAPQGAALYLRWLGILCLGVFAIGYKDPSVGRVATLAGLIVASAGFFWLAHRKRK